MEEICMESVTVTPNPVSAGGEIRVEVLLYTLFPAKEIYPAPDLYPGADIFALHPNEKCYPDINLCPAKGENEI